MASDLCMLCSDTIASTETPPFPRISCSSFLLMTSLILTTLVAFTSSLTESANRTVFFFLGRGGGVTGRGRRAKQFPMTLKILVKGEIFGGRLEVASKQDLWEYIWIIFIREKPKENPQDF